MRNLILTNWLSILVILTLLVYVVLLVKNKKWDQLRGLAYRLILQAEAAITGSKKGQERFEQVFQQIYIMVPPWIRFFFSETLVKEKLQDWYNDIKDYLSDGKLDGNEFNITKII